ECPKHEARRPPLEVRASSFFRHSCFVITHSLLYFLISARAADPIDLTNLPPPATTQVDFARDIAPIFERSCLRCHGPERPKSKFRLDDRAAALQGGEDNRDDIIPGDSAHRPLIHYVARLIKEMEMPPPGKGEPLTHAQLG